MQGRKLDLSSASSSHAVLLVGMDTAPAVKASGFMAGRPATDYWIIRNSWGTKW